MLLAVIRFNEGAVGLKGVLENMAIQSGKFMSKSLDLKGLYHASKKHSQTGKQRRKQVKNEQNKLQGYSKFITKMSNMSGSEM